MKDAVSWIKDHVKEWQNVVIGYSLDLSYWQGKKNETITVDELMGLLNKVK